MDAPRAGWSLSGGIDRDRHEHGKVPAAEGCPAEQERLDALCRDMEMDEKGHGCVEDTQG